MVIGEWWLFCARAKAAPATCGGRKTSDYIGTLYSISILQTEITSFRVLLRHPCLRNQCSFENGKT